MINRNKTQRKWNLWKSELEAMAKVRRVAPEDTRIALASILALEGFGITERGALVVDSDYQNAFNSWMEAVERIYSITAPA